MNSVKLIWLTILGSILVVYPLSLPQLPTSLIPTANVSTTWINDDSLPLLEFDDHSKMRPFLFRFSNQTSYGCGFYCNGTCKTYLFAIFTTFAEPQVYTATYTIFGLPVVWSANRNNPVKLNATLELTSGGDFVLKDADGSLVWSTNTSRKGVAGLNMTGTGNLVLFDVNKKVVWQSFDHPTDTLLLGQKLVPGQKLIASVSETNWTGGQYFMSLVPKGLFAFVGSDPPHVYARIDFVEPNDSYVIFTNGSLNERLVYSFWTGSSAQFLRLGHDGHLKLYDFDALDWSVVGDLTNNDVIGRCKYPMVCGVNGICSEEQCSCPTSNYFRPINDRKPNLGCSAVTQLTCNASKHHSFVDLENVTYFTFITDFRHSDVHRCKEACLNNCSCKAALFRYNKDPSNGECFLPSEIFSLINNGDYNTSVHIKVQTLQSEKEPSGSIVAFLISVLTVVGVGVVLVTICLRRKKKNSDEAEDDYLDHVPGMPSRLTYEELKFATENFSKKLGQGGFGSVFEGTLTDGTKVAVKCLDGVGHVKNSFLAEVESIGSIHHVNLVRLVGFSAEKSNLLLVYEYMSNGSLDRWIYKSPDAILDWKCRRKIIHDVAKGLAYLHEDCRQKIIHLDIKPQNILLDENFNAKLSDFGLSKLIDKDQSQVITIMRGTPGYLAPEWLCSVITEKVDVYSFGIVVLEILCGRKNFDLSEPEETRHLLRLFKEKTEEDRMLDLVDKRSKDMQSRGKEVEEMMQLAAWCLLSDYSRRPSMSVVVKVLEGGMDVEKNINYSSLNSQPSTHQETEAFMADVTPLFASVLSGPR